MNSIGDERSTTAARPRAEHVSTQAAHIAGWRRALAEFVGTFFLVMVGAGIEGMANLVPDQTDRLAAAAGPGLVVMAMIYAFGQVSGAHFNPVVTLTFVLRRAFPLRWVAAYLGSQVAGAVAASALLRALLDPGHHAGSSSPLRPSLELAMEAVLTCLLILVVLTTAHEHALVGTQAALAVGGAITACRLLGARLAGASMNPASALGSAIVTNQTGRYWLHVVGPLLGGLVAYAVMTALHPRSNDGECEAAEGNEGKDHDV